MKAKSRIKQRRDYYGKFTARMSWKERLGITTLLLCTMGWGYINHSNYVISADTSDPVIEVRGPERASDPVQVQEISVPKRVEELTEREQIIAYIVEVFGEDIAPRMILIAECESTLDPRRIGDKKLKVYDPIHDEMVGDSVGLFQIRTGGMNKDGHVWNRARANGMTADEFRTYLLDPTNNTDYAKTILDRSGVSPWTCARGIVL